MHAADIANAKQNNPAKILQVVDELSYKISLHRTFLVDTFKKCVYLFRKKRKIAFSVTLDMNFSLLMEKNKTLFIVSIESLYLKDLQTVIQLNSFNSNPLGVWEFVRIRWFFEL